MAIERIVPGTIEWDAFYANHIARYTFAKVQLDNNESKKINILDAACGVGYGSDFLATKLNCTVTAVDRSIDALTIANKCFASPAIRFLEDDCHTLEAAATFGTYDAVVSFETLEHLPYPEKFIAACYQNLSSGGKLIISTPNQSVSSPEGNLDWEFHEKEYQPQELLELLSKAGFSNIKLYGQQMTAIGKLRSQLRAELNKVNSNPFMRLGRFIQKVFKGHQYNAVLPEQAEDFEIVFYNSPDAINALAQNGPFVLIAVCNK
jgi:SAM-dependent methyltransferase